MSEGFEGLRAAKQEAEKREARINNQGDYKPKLWFSLPNDGDSAIVRFLEPTNGDPITWAWVHEIPIPGKWWPSGGPMTRDVPCLDQKKNGVPCPACESSDKEIWKKKWKGWINLIWRDAPRYEIDDNGKVNKKKILGKEDQVAIWGKGETVFEELEENDSTYKGLPNRDFRIKRKGESTDTTYTVKPADPDGGPQDMSANDQKLAADKPDLSWYKTPPSYDDFAEMIPDANVGISNRNQAASVDVDPSENPFELARRARD